MTDTFDFSGSYNITCNSLTDASEYRHALLVGIDIDGGEHRGGTTVWIPCVFDDLRACLVVATDTSLWHRYPGSAIWYRALSGGSVAALDTAIAGEQTRHWLGEPSDSFIHDVGNAAVATWLLRRMRFTFFDMEHATHTRWAEVGNAIQEAEYEKIREWGCCGEFDTIVVHPYTRREFRIGCNYGH